MNEIIFFIEDLEYQFRCQWTHAEYPQVGDSIAMLHVCSTEQEEIFKEMSLPKHLRDYKVNNAFDYLDYCGCDVTCRAWGGRNTSELTIFCKRRN
ncbi:MAG: hypothetical protein SNG38_08860 [Rikenellaceae bacterium]